MTINPSIDYFKRLGLLIEPTDDNDTDWLAVISETDGEIVKISKAAFIAAVQDGLVVSVTGTAVDNTDPSNPVINKQDLQSVTDEDSTTTNSISVIDSEGNVLVRIQNAGGDGEITVTSADGGSTSSISPVQIISRTLILENTSNFKSTIDSSLLTGNRHQDVPDKDGTFAMLDDINAVIETTGTAITFTGQTIYNSDTAPTTANITNDLTGAKKGIVQKIYHNNATEPTYPAGWVLVGGGAYVTGVLNIIYAEWCGGTRVEYWIVQEA